jgi:hypothetical protein
MGAHLNVLQRAVVLGVTVIGALLNGAGDALVGVGVHLQFLLFFWIAKLLCANFRFSYTRLHFAKFCGMLFITSIVVYGTKPSPWGGRWREAPDEG